LAIPRTARTMRNPARTDSTTKTIHDVVGIDEANVDGIDEARGKVCRGDNASTAYPYRPLRSPATRLAEINFLFEIVRLWDFITDPTVRPATITGIRTGIWGMELAPCLPQGCNELI